MINLFVFMIYIARQTGREYLTEWRSFDRIRQFREVESDYFGRYGIDSQYSPCLFWISSKIDYKEVFFKEHPELRGEVWLFV